MINDRELWAICFVPCYHSFFPHRFVAGVQKQCCGKELPNLPQCPFLTLS